MPYVVDRAGPLSNKRRTPQGGFLVDATLARVGVLEYPERKQKHLNTAEVLQASVAGIAVAPVTNRHPSRMVDSSTYAEVVKGHVVGEPRFADGMLHATLAIQDADLIADIETGVAREVSMGYLSENAEESGEYDGHVYDHVRKEITWNHIAVVPAGRAGKDVCLMLDAMDIPGENVMKFKVNGKEYDADKVQAAIDALEMLFGNATAEAKEAKDALVVVKTELMAAKSEATIDAAVAVKLAKVEAEKKGAERKAAVAKKYPKMVLDGKTQEAIDAVFETITAEDAEISTLAPGAAGGLPSAERETAKDEAHKPRFDPRKAMLDENRKISAGKVAEGE